MTSTPSEPRSFGGGGGGGECGTSQSWVCRVLAGQQDTTTERAELMLSALGIDVSDLIRKEGE